MNVANGTMWHKFKDFSIPGRTPDTKLELVRTYLSHTILPSGDFGPHWFHNWETRIIPVSSNANSNLVWVDSSGAAWIFKRNSNNSFANPPGFFGNLIETPQAYFLRKPHGILYQFSKNETIAPIGRLVSLQERHGESVSLIYNSNGDLDSVTSGLAGSIHFARNSDGRVADVLLQRDGLNYHYEYDSSERLISSADFDGNTTRFTYASDQAGSLSNTLLASIMDPIGRVISNTFDPSTGRTLSQTEPGNGRRLFFYFSDSSGLPITFVQDIDGNFSTYHFDSNYLLKEAGYADRASELTTWTPQNQIATFEDALGFVTRYGYDTNGNRTSVQKPLDTSTTRITYDPNFDQPTSIIPLAGAPISLGLDPENGDIASVTRTSGSTTLSETIGHDTFGNANSFSNGLASYSNQTEANGLLTNVFDLRNPETRAYDSRARVISRSFASGRTLHYSWDNHDRLIRVDDTSGPSLAIVYDVMGRVLSKTVSDGHTDETTRYTWDDQDRLTSLSNELGEKTTYEYDVRLFGGSVAVLPMPIAKVDPIGNRTAYQYDNRQRLISVTDARGAVTSFRYNLRGERTAVIDPLGKMTFYTFDGNGRVTSRTRPSVVTNSAGVTVETAETENYFYDASEKLIRDEKLSAAGGKAITELTYDAFDRVTRKLLKRVDSHGAVSIEDDSSFEYSNELDRRLLTKASNKVAILEFTYDSVPPFLPKSYSVRSAVSGNPLGIIEGKYQISRGASNEPETIVDSSGKSVFKASYDRAARLLSIASGNVTGSSPAALSFALEYDGFGRKASLRSSNGYVQEIHYDALNRAVNLSWTEPRNEGPISNPSISEDLVFDPNGNIVSQKREFGTLTYAYDEANELTSLDAANARKISDTVLNRSLDQTFSYDPAGNRTFASIDGGSAEFINNQILKSSVSTFESDADGFGNLSAIISSQTTSRQNMSYRVDGRLNTIALVAEPNWSGDDDSDDAVVTKAEYFYDALGRRLAKRVTENEWLGSNPRNRKLSTQGRVFTHSYSYLIDQDKILLARAADGSLSLYLDGQGIDEHLGKISGREITTFASDHLGSILNSPLTGEFKTYGPFGTPTVKGKALGKIRREEPVLYGFTGRQFDLENGFYYFRARMYNPGTGRFLTKDPIGFNARDHNLYRYTFNQPLRFTDPSGEIVIDMTPDHVSSRIANSPEYRAAAADPNIVVYVNYANDLSYRGQSAYGATVQATVGSPIYVFLDPKRTADPATRLATIAHEFVHVDQLRLNKVGSNGSLDELDAYLKESTLGAACK